MVLTGIALLKSQTNVSIVSEDCWFAVELSGRIWGKSRSYLNLVFNVIPYFRTHIRDGTFPHSKFYRFRLKVSTGCTSSVI